MSLKFKRIDGFSQVTYFPLVYYEEFLQMEADLRQLGKTHTTMLATERSEAKLGENHKEEIAKWPAAVEWMTRAKAATKNQKGKRGGGKNKAKGGGGASGKKASVEEEGAAKPQEVAYRREFWTLMLWGSYDWRTPNVKSPDRDYRRFAKVALVEQAAVENYRAELLDYSPAARVLRSEFRKSMKGFCVDRTIKFEDDDPQPTDGTWVFADNIPDAVREEDAGIVVDIDHLYRERASLKLGTKHRLEYSRHMTKFQKLGALTATPYTTDIHPEIADLSTKLDKVSIMPL